MRFGDGFGLSDDRVLVAVIWHKNGAVGQEVTTEPGGVYSFD